MGSPRLNEQTRARIIKLSKEGLSYRMIAKRINANEKTIARVVKAAEGNPKECAGPTQHDVLQQPND